MFENIGHFFKRMVKTEQQKELGSKDAAKERLHLVLMQDRANVSADFLELMKQEIIDVIKKYIVVDEESIDVRLTNQSNDDGTNGAPALYANIPIVNIKNDMMAEKIKEFEGVDFNKEMGITPMEETKDEENVPSVIELPESYSETENTASQEIPQVADNTNDEKTAIVEEEEEVKELFEEIDDDDDDVTFDDLLKAAEAAEAAEKEAIKKQENENKDSEIEIKEVKKTDNKSEKKTDKKTENKQQNSKKSNSTNSKSASKSNKPKKK
jgi:cell division topological specificity factor